MKHHYVPAFYLRAFTDPACPPNYEPYLWVVDLDTGKIRRQSPDNTAALTDYYAVGDGENRYDVEEYLSAAESQAAPVFARILGDYSVVDAPDKAVLSYFAALQIVRVPQFRERIEEFMTGAAQKLNALMIRSRAGFEEGLRASHLDRSFTTEEVDEIYAYASDPRNYTISANPQAALGHALNVVPKVADILNQMSWFVMEPAGADNFWSSDNPLYYINPESNHPFFGHALGVKGVEVNLPIGPRRCMLMAWSDVPPSTRVPFADLRGAQERGIAGAKRYLFCSTERDAQQALSAHRRMYPRRG